jgi:TRAP-type C4-dicarboxylate transport system substrate-binding protein
VVDNVIQMAFGIPSNFSRKFSNTNMVALPLIGDKSEDSSVALWRLYQSGALGAEYADIKPLLVAGLPQQGIHTRGTRIEKLEDAKGVRLNSGNKVTTDIIAALGATPSSINVGEMYEAVQRGTVEGVFMPWTAFQPFKLGEVTRFHLDESFGTSPATIFMSKKVYDGLPEAARKVIDANSGEQQSREFGRIWDVEQARARDVVKGQAGHTVTSLEPAERERWRQRLEGVIAEWIKSNPEGEKVLAMFKAELERVRSARR